MGRQAYPAYFDVDWEPPEARLHNTILLPVLGDHYGKELEAGHMTLIRAGANFMFSYGDRTFPAAPRLLDNLLMQVAEPPVATNWPLLPIRSVRCRFRALRSPEICAGGIGT